MSETQTEPQEKLFKLVQIETVRRECQASGVDQRTVLLELQEGMYDGDLVEKDSGVLYSSVTPLDRELSVVVWDEMGEGSLPEAARFLTAEVCTYNGDHFPKAVEAGKVEEYGKPFALVTIIQESGLRLLLGGTDPNDFTTPGRSDVLVERQPDRWALFVTAQYGGDLDMVVYIMDDGRVVVVPERYVGHDNVTVSETVPPAPPEPEAARC
jgi:hypothetical protein